MVPMRAPELKKAGQRSGQKATGTIVVPHLPKLCVLFVAPFAGGFGPSRQQQHLEDQMSLKKPKLTLGFQGAF